MFERYESREDRAFVRYFARGKVVAIKAAGRGEGSDGRDEFANRIYLSLRIVERIYLAMPKEPRLSGVRLYRRETKSQREANRAWKFALSGALILHELRSREPRFIRTRGSAERAPARLLGRPHRVSGKREIFGRERARPGKQSKD